MDISSTKEGQFVTGAKEGVGQGVCACTGMRVGKLRENGALRDDSMIKIHPKPLCLCEKLQETRGH